MSADAERRVWTGCREAVAGLAGTDLQTLLLSVARDRAERVRAPQVLRRWRQDRFVGAGGGGPAARRAGRCGGGAGPGAGPRLLHRADAAATAVGAEIGDGRFTDWTARLLGTAKERCLISCVATERLAAVAARADAPHVRS